MKKIIIILFCSIFLISLSYAYSGCCLNPTVNTCQFTDNSLCCPENPLSYSGSPLNVTDCQTNFFVNNTSPTACLELNNNLCSQGCCCKFEEALSGKTYTSAYPENKLNCQGDNLKWLDSEKCSLENCSLNAIEKTKVIQPQSEEEDWGKICDPSVGCKGDYICRQSINKNSGTWRCCSYPKPCANEETCIQYHSNEFFQGVYHSCLNTGRWRSSILDQTPTPVEYQCDFTFQNKRCEFNQGTCRGGFFANIYRSIKEEITGNYCNKYEEKTGSSCNEKSWSYCCNPTNLNEKLDWRNNNGDFVTSVKDQGNCNSCWAFGSVAAAESSYLISKNLPGGEVDFSEQFLITYSQAGTCNRGAHDQAIEFIGEVGLIKEDCFPYQARTDPWESPCDNWENQLTKFSTSYKMVNGFYYSPYAQTYLLNIPCMKNAIKGIGPVPFSYSAHGYYNSQTGIYECGRSNKRYGHAVLVIGFNDQEKYWLAKNSRGIDDPGNGFIKIGYQECDQAFYGAIEGAQIANPSASYCNDLGYNFSIIKTPEGEKGLCTFPDGTNSSSWDFLTGKQKTEFNYCSLQGFETKTKDDGFNSLSPTYSVCLIEGKEVQVTDLMNYTNMTEIRKALDEENLAKITEEEPNNYLPLIIISFIIICFGILVLIKEKFK